MSCKMNSGEIMSQKNIEMQRGKRKKPYDYTEEWEKIDREYKENLSAENLKQYEELTESLDYEGIWKHLGFQNWLKNNYPQTWGVSQDEQFNKKWKERDYESWLKHHEKERNSFRNASPTVIIIVTAVCTFFIIKFLSAFGVTL